MKRQTLVAERNGREQIYANPPATGHGLRRALRASLLLLLWLPAPFAVAQPHPGPVDPGNRWRIDPNIGFDTCIHRENVFTPDRFGGLPPDRMQVVATYNGTGNAALLSIHLWNPTTHDCCTLSLGLDNSSILTREYTLNGYVPTGVFDVNGVSNGAGDGIAFGLYFRDVAGDRHLLRSAGAGLAVTTPNFVGGWPFNWPQAGWDARLTGITGTTYPDFVARRQAQITLSGAQWMPNGTYHVPTDGLIGDLNGDECVDLEELGQVETHFGWGCGPLDCHAIVLQSGFTAESAPGGLPPNRMQVVAVYDGTPPTPPSSVTLTIDLWNPSTNQRCALVVTIPSNGTILTQEYAMGGFVPSGAVQVSGVIANGSTDGVAFGLYFRNATGDRRALRSSTPNLGAGMPNFFGGWPVAWAETNWDSLLVGLPGPTNAVARRQAQMTLSGAQFLPNGTHSNYNNWPRPLVWDIDGDGCVDNIDYGLVYSNLNKGCCQ